MTDVQIEILSLTMMIRVIRMMRVILVILADGQCPERGGGVINPHLHVLQFCRSF